MCFFPCVCFVSSGFILCRLAGSLCDWDLEAETTKIRLGVIWVWEAVGIFVKLSSEGHDIIRFLDWNQTGTLCCEATLQTTNLCFEKQLIVGTEKWRNSVCFINLCCHLASLFSEAGGAVRDRICRQDMQTGLLMYLLRFHSPHCRQRLEANKFLHHSDWLYSVHFKALAAAEPQFLQPKKRTDTAVCSRQSTTEMTCSSDQDTGAESPHGVTETGDYTSQWEDHAL